MSLRTFLLQACLGASIAALPKYGTAAEAVYPQLVTVRYEAQDPKLGGHFVLWVEREKIWYGLDQKLYPAARSVEVRHLTPTPGSPLFTMITVTPLNGAAPDFFHLSGVVRFKVTGMVVKSTNIP